MFFPIEDKVNLCDPTRAKLLVRTAFGPPGLATTIDKNSIIPCARTNNNKLCKSNVAFMKNSPGVWRLLFCYKKGQKRKYINNVTELVNCQQKHHLKALVN